MKRLLAGVLALSLTAAASAGNFRFERDIPYGTRLDQPGEGGKHGHRSGQFFDLYWPNEVTANTPVFLYVHGGAWSQKWDKDVDGWHILSRLAERGVVCCSMNYVLQNDVLTDPKMPNRPNATFADMLRDIDLMISYLATNLPTRGLSPRKIGIGGTSAGAHLSALYACDGANPAALGLNLRHALPIGFVFDNVGPMDFSTPQMKAVLENREASDVPNLVLRSFRTLLARLTNGEPPMKWAPISLVNAKTPPFILAYNKLHPFSSTDGLVETAHCSRMEEALGRVGVRSESRFCWFRSHGWHTDSQLEWIVDTCAEFAALYL